MNLAESLADAVDGSRDWTLNLVADIRGDEWMYQPAPGMQHALWLCGHLASAQQTLVLIRCLGRQNAYQDFTRHFPIGGPVADGADHAYPAPEVVLDTMAAIHAEVLEAIRGMSDGQLAEPCFGKDGAAHPHYTTKGGAIAHCARHEGFHAGQIALLRGLMGKRFLR